MRRTCEHNGNCTACPGEIFATCEFAQACDNEIEAIVAVMKRDRCDPATAAAIVRQARMHIIEHPHPQTLPICNIKPNGLAWTNLLKMARIRW